MPVITKPLSKESTYLRPITEIDQCPLSGEINNRQVFFWCNGGALYCLLYINPPPPTPPCASNYPILDHFEKTSTLKVTR